MSRPFGFTVPFNWADVDATAVAALVTLVGTILVRLAKFGEPQPVTSSQPVPAAKPLLPLVTSWKSAA